MRRSLILLTLLAALGLAAPAAAGTAGTYKGKATNMDRDFNYGSVTMKVRAGKVTSLVIKAVTTTGCAGFMDVVFAPRDPETDIIVGSARLRDGRLSVTYRPVKSVEEQSTTIRARISGSKVTGTFESGGLCDNGGRFTARK